jgi:tetratricopeptide (TPR) repeat protein
MLADERTLNSIRQLPETKEALMSPSIAQREKQQVVDNLMRAVDVFGRLNRGGAEHLFCLAMLAEISGVAGSIEAEEALDNMLDELSLDSGTGGDARSAVLVAKAKSLYYRGEFELSRTICNDILEDDPNSHPFGTVMAARTIFGAARLQTMETIDDAFSVRDPFRMVVKHVERNQPSNKLALAVANFNMGTAEAVYAATVSKFNNVSVPLDSALKWWKQSSTIVANRNFSSLMKARSHTNIGWSLMEMASETGNMDFLKQSSENAKTALGCYQESSIKDGLARTLCLLGILAHKSGQAVTAEGLFASALSYEKETVVGKLTYVESLNTYANLLDDWDKREDEAESMREKAKAVPLPVKWRRSTTMTGSLCL